MTGQFSSKLKNWWWYHKKAALAAALVAAALLYMGIQNSRTVEPDYHVGLVTMTPYSPEQLADMEQRLCAAGQDQNGDGQVLVQLHTYYVDLADDSPNASHNHYEVVMALDADLVGKVSGLFLLSDPEAFQRTTNGLLSETMTAWEYGLTLARRTDAAEADIQLFDSLQ